MIDQTGSGDSGGTETCSVLVPVLNEELDIEATLDAMLRQRFDGELEFLLIDGGSSDRTMELVTARARTDPRIRLLRNPRRITPSALNIALGHAHGRWVARMDAHTEYPDDYVMLGVERLARGDTRWVSGPALPRGRSPVSRAVALALQTPLGRGASRKWAREGDGDERVLDSGVFAGVWARDTLLEYGGWDERWPRNQDSEMAGRFLARGERLIMLFAMASHYRPRDSLSSLVRQYFEYGAYRTKTAMRHPHTMRRSHLLAPAVVVAAGAGVASPRPVRALARAGMAAYSLALAAAAGAAYSDAESPGDALLVPVVLALMHFGHGLGAWRESVAHGPPMAALAHAAGLTGLSRRLTVAAEDVFAPSLTTNPDDVQP